MAVVRNREVATKQGFVVYYSDRGAVGAQGKWPLYYRQGGHLSGVAVKRVPLYTLIINNRQVWSL